MICPFSCLEKSLPTQTFTNPIVFLIVYNLISVNGVKVPNFISCTWTTICSRTIYDKAFLSLQMYKRPKWRFRIRGGLFPGSSRDHAFELSRCPGLFQGMSLLFDDKAFFSPNKLEVVPFRGSFLAFLRDTIKNPGTSSFSSARISLSVMFPRSCCCSWFRIHIFLHPKCEKVNNTLSSRASSGPPTSCAFK